MVEFANRESRIGGQLRPAPVRSGAADVPAIAIAQGGRLLRVAATEIDFLTADRDYVHVHAAGRRYLLRETMQEMIGRLGPAGFERIHRSVIVNMRKVRDVRRDDTGRPMIVMDTGDCLPVGKSYRKAVMHRLKDGDTCRPLRAYGR